MKYLTPSVSPSARQPSLLRRATPVGTRSPYSLPFVILPVSARSPFRFIRHWRRSTPNPGRGAFWCALQLKHSHGGPPMTAPTTHPINFSAKTRGRSASPHFYAYPPSGGFRCARKRAYGFAVLAAAAGIMVPSPLTYTLSTLAPERVIR